LHAAFELPQHFNRSPEEYAPISLDKDTYLDTRNTAKNASTGMSPFDLLYVQPQNVVERILGVTDRDPNDNLQAQVFVESARNRLKDAREVVPKSLRLRKLYYDRRHGPIRPIEVGHFVSVRLAQHPVSLVTRTKLTQQKHPPYKVLEVLANKHAVRLDIPLHVGIHPVLNIQHVGRAVDPSKDPFQRSDHAQPPAVDTAGDRWEGEIIDEKSTRSGKKRYLVHWIGWDERYDEWLPPDRIDKGMIDNKINISSGICVNSDLAFCGGPKGVLSERGLCLCRVRAGGFFFPSPWTLQDTGAGQCYSSFNVAPPNVSENSRFRRNMDHKAGSSMLT
jgi:hypothetical protein